MPEWHTLALSPNKTPRNRGFYFGMIFAFVCIMTTLRLRNTLFDNFFNTGLNHVLYEDNDDYHYEETKDSLIVLPTDYEKPQSPYVKAIVTQVADDSKFYNKLSANDVVLIERRMLHKVEISEYSFYLVLENYIYGRINNEIE